jgi:hypothetical protein
MRETVIAKSKVTSDLSTPPVMGAAEDGSGEQASGR